MDARYPLRQEDREAILALPANFRTVEPGKYLVREGDEPQYCAFIHSGFAYRQKSTADGSRQIVAILVPGDFVDLQQIFLNISDHSVQALTQAEITEIDIGALREIALTRAAVSKAMWLDALVESSIYREWILNVGRRDARARISHLLCELAVRLKISGGSDDYHYRLPMSQEQLGDAVGLTSVHVNRVLKTLSEEGLIEREIRNINVVDWDRLCKVADFNDRYLHVDQPRNLEIPSAER